MSNSALFVYLIFFQFGRITSTPVLVGRTLLTGIAEWMNLSKKWSVAPVSVTVVVARGEFKTNWLALGVFNLALHLSFLPPFL